MNQTHDPLIKKQIRDAIEEQLYAPVVLKFNQRIKELIRRNTILGGFSHRSFMYKSKFYNDDPLPVPYRKNRLIPQLEADMKELLNDQKQILDLELPIVIGLVVKVLNISNEKRVWLKLLPESVHAAFQHIAAPPITYQPMLVSDEFVTQFQTENAQSIQLMKNRMMLNLLV